MGMMIIVAVLKRTGVFEFLAILAAKRSRGRPYRLMVLLCVLTAVASAVLDNVTTVLLVAPVTFLVCDQLGLRPVPFLIAEVLASNIGGAATLVGDPPNIIIASRGDLTFNDFLVHMAPIVVVLMVVFLGLCRWLFRRQLTGDPERAEAVMQLNEREAIEDPRLLAISLGVLALVVVAFVLHPVLHYEPSVVALLGAGLLLLVTRFPVTDAMREVEWPTLAFFAGLFVMVGALVDSGVVGGIADRLADATDGRLGLATMLLLGGSARAVRPHRQHPVRRHDGPGRRRAGRPRRPRRPGALVGARPRRRPRRQRDRDRRVGQRGDARARRARGPPDRLLGVHPVRRGGHRRHRRAVRAVPLAALPVRLDRP